MMLLTDDEIMKISNDIERSDFFDIVIPYARAIEAATVAKLSEGVEFPDNYDVMKRGELQAMIAAAVAKERTHQKSLRVATGWAAPKDHYAVPVLFNPYTGEPRDARDVRSDPQGILIVPPGKVNMLSAGFGGAA